MTENLLTVKTNKHLDMTENLLTVKTNKNKTNEQADNHFHHNFDKGDNYLQHTTQFSD